MAYTTVDAVASTFPTFKRGGSNQAPSNPIIETWVADVSGEIDAVLTRRFSESIGETPFSGNFDAWVAALSSQAIGILEKINRYGAAAQLGFALASIGSKSTKILADTLEENYTKMLNALDGRGVDGEPLSSGPYDHFFDAQARVQSPRQAFAGVSGGDQPSNQTAQDVGLTMPFSSHEII
jgi:hypothetical protein